jgi:hypothetical protein
VFPRILDDDLFGIEMDPQPADVGHPNAYEPSPTDVYLTHVQNESIQPLAQCVIPEEPHLTRTGVHPKMLQPAH